MHHKSTASSVAAAKYRTRLAAAFAAVAAPLFPAAIKKSPLIEMNRSINNPIAAPSPTNCRANHSRIAAAASSIHFCFAVRLSAFSVFANVPDFSVPVVPSTSVASISAASNGIPSSCRSINRLAVPGRAFPVSHLATACRVTPSCSASISWVMPFSFRADAIFSPNVMVLSPFLWGQHSTAVLLFSSNFVSLFCHFSAISSFIPRKAA